MPYCPVCKQQLGGDNSYSRPYMCKCGVWTANKYPFDGEYEIISLTKKK